MITTISKLFLRILLYFEKFSPGIRELKILYYHIDVYVFGD